MKNIKTYNIVFVFTFIVSILVGVFIKDVYIEFNTQLSESITFMNVFLNNAVASAKYLIPFLNMLFLFWEVLYNTIIINSIINYDKQAILRVIFHLPFEIITIYCTYIISFIILFDNKRKIYKYITVYILALIIGALVEVYIFGRIV